MSIELVEFRQPDLQEAREVDAKVIDLAAYVAIRKSGLVEIDQTEQTQLSPLKLNLLELISLGNSTAQSGYNLGRSMPYLKNLRAELPKNLGARNINHAIRLGFEMGLLTPLDDELEFNYYVHPLTPMQSKVLELTSLGNSKYDIGEILGIEPRTAKNYSYAVRYNLGAHNTPNAIRIGILSGLIPINSDSRI